MDFRWAAPSTSSPRLFPLFDRADLARVFHRGFRDHPGYAVAADTLFVIGGTRAGELAGEEVCSLADDGPAQLTAGVRWCAEIGLGPRRPHHRWQPRRVPPRTRPGNPDVTQDWTTP